MLRIWKINRRNSGQARNNWGEAEHLGTVGAGQGKAVVSARVRIANHPPKQNRHKKPTPLPQFPIFTPCSLKRPFRYRFLPPPAGGVACLRTINTSARGLSSTIQIGSAFPYGTLLSINSRSIQISNRAIRPKLEHYAPNGWARKWP
jgi:hypothetical protein